MSLTFVMVLRSGGIYSPLWVERLCRQAREHLKPDRIVCFTDMFCWPDLGEEVDTMPLEHRWPGWFSKLEIFRPTSLAGPCLYVDLDSLILRPIPDLAVKIALWQSAVPAAGLLALLDDFFTPARPASGVMLWVPSVHTEAIYHTFAQDPERGMQTRHGDGGWIGRYSHARLQSIFPGVFGSYKAHKLVNGPGRFAHVSMHGVPKQNDFAPEHWVAKAWIGPNTQGVGSRDSEPTNNRKTL